MRVRRPLTSLSRWRLQSAPPQRFEPELRPTLRRVALALPEGFNPRTRALAQQWRREAGTNDAAIVQRALDWIRSDFAYTLDTPLLGRHAVDEFLFDAAGRLLRALQLVLRGADARGGHPRARGHRLRRRLPQPASAVTGSCVAWMRTPGPRSGSTDRGWVRVDPTAAVAPERIYDTLEDRAGIGGGLFGDIRGMAPMLDVTRLAAPRLERLRAGLRCQPPAPAASGRWAWARWTVRAWRRCCSRVAALALLWMAWLSRRGERERDPVLRAWHALGRRYQRLGLAREPWEPSRRWAARVALQRPDLAGELNALSQRFSDWRYAPATAQRDGARELARQLRAHRPAALAPHRPTGDRR